MGRRLILLAGGLLGVVSVAHAGTISDVVQTKHNLSISGSSAVKAVSESQICAFCHTPHGATLAPKAPLWNRQLSGATYKLYSSGSIEATDMGQPTEMGSKLCLSCHDGTLAIGVVNVLNGKANQTISLAGGVTTMPAGSGANTGDTRNLGVDLSNDHPIAFTYNSTLATADGELRDPSLAANNIATRAVGVKPLVPLDSGKVECISCHDPHIRGTTENIKFLRLNRFQTTADPVSGNFNAANDIICLGCHSKDGWVGSAHANRAVADETFTSTAAAQHDFPTALPVWRAACLNCHDTHTVQGARQLLREGTDSSLSPKQGGNPAQEETCYQCHSSPGASGALTLQGFGTQVPDIKSDFLLPRRMPITDASQGQGGVTAEVHSIGTQGSGSGKDLLESQALLGKGNLGNRHVECTDCHNPHRVIKNRSAFGDPNIPEAAGTHTHDASIQHSNVISGVLRGAWGVEPNYGAATWGALPAGYIVKKGVQPVNGPMDASQTYVTKEYQICLKCHSDYGFDDTNRPTLGYLGGTPSGTNGMIQYTNQAMEFQAPATHKGETTAIHRSWHPVIDSTGRTTAIRGAVGNAFLAPWSGTSGAFIGYQTMYCSDCHGSDTAAGTAVPTGGENGNSWGPHGSTNNFILKGNWDNQTGTGKTGDLCFKCHDYNQYANPATNPPQISGFRDVNGGGGGMGGGGGGMMFPFVDTNQHILHAWRIGRLECSWCHVMVPHGWKNKALLVDITQDGGVEPFTSAPYYNQAMLGGGGAVTFKTSGNWTSADCGGRMWMKMSCANPP